MKAQPSRKGRDIFSIYELPHRAYVAKVYPARAPNGSEIVLYGHDNGVRICWRGGRFLKESYSRRESLRVNGTRAGRPIAASDSDDEASHSYQSRGRGSHAELEPEFESEEEELDASHPAASIIQTLDLALNTQVLHICTPPLPDPGLPRPADTVPKLFNDHIIFAIACADCSIRLIRLPKIPPSHTRKSTRKLGKQEPRFGEEVLVIGSQMGHQGIPGGITMTWTTRNSPSFQKTEDEMEDDDSSIADLARARSSLQLDESASKPPREFDFILASHSAEGTGTLHIFRVQLPSEGSDQSISTSAVLPYQTIPLPSPAIRVVFSPNPFPNKRHTQLLISDCEGHVRVYDPFLRADRNMRAVRSEDSSDQSRGGKGSWLASFSTGFKVAPRSDLSYPGTAQRKLVLDAQWTMGSRSVVALLADGEWGVWDIDSAAPSASKIASTINFAIGGIVGASTNRSNPSSNKQSSTLSPMTPNTRRTKQDTFFHGPSSSFGSPSSSHSARGGISVASITSTSGGLPEDSIIIWYGNDVYRIPNLAQYWSRNASGSAGGLYGPGLARVEGIDLRGEIINSVDQFSLTATTSQMAIPRDILVAAEHRLLICGRPRPQGRSSSTLFDRMKRKEQPDVDVEMVDRALLARRELDLGGMDRMLESMAAGQSIEPTSKNVGFAS